MVAELAGEHAGEWDLAGRLPADVVGELAGKGVLCAEVPVEYGGMGLSSVVGGELTAAVGRHCGSLRSLLTSHGMAAWTLLRFGSAEQKASYLPRMTAGALAGVAFSEPGAGSDLSALTTTIVDDGRSVVVAGHKVWVTGAAYAELLVVFGRYGDGAAVVVVPATAPGVRVEPVADPVGCRAAGHADVHLDEVRLPADALLGAAGLPVGLLATTTLGYGRLSVAWGCVGILRACLAEATRHASTREQFGVPIAEHQLVARHLAELLVAERSATHTCAHASRCWDDGAPEVASAAMLAKHLAATSAVRGAASAVQVLGSAGARDGHPVARAYRDAKLMEIIEGSSEICQLALARHAVAEWT
ncbi:acyl-CoA dehydrogenase family protein [Actinophytocola sp.]|uniref:acyl-CoA dehydrogenase family protein n=1 Tax=Actinophytocola sp. TaxID=1872138 RepID=UPI003D6BE121